MLSLLTWFHMEVFLSELNHSLYKSFMSQETWSRQFKPQELSVSGRLLWWNPDRVLRTPGLC